MNLDEWRAQQQAGRTVDLPSGLAVTLRKNYGLMDLVMDGNAPAEVEPFIDNLIQGGGAEITASTMGQIGGLVNLLLEKALLGPEGLAVSELPASDRMSLFQLLSGEAESPASLGIVSDGDDV